MRHNWTKKEIEYLRINYSDMSTKEIAANLNLSASCVYNKAYDLGLYKSPEYIAKNCRMITPNKQTQFGKGHEPWNKGKKGLQIGGKKTQFKKGIVPYNTKPIGYKSLRDGYLVERTEKGFEFVHVLLWKKHNGIIPKGKFVVFKDRNKQNICIENLEIIDRAENMRRNSIMNLPDEIREVVNIKKSITRHITEHGKKQNKRPA